MKLGIATMIPTWLSLTILLLATLGICRPTPSTLTPEKRLDSSQLTYHPTSDPNGSNTGILIFPGGGYANLAASAWEASTYLNNQGYDTWILNYTVTTTNNGASVYPAPINEAIAAVNQIKQSSSNSPEKLGILGFSAGGHLAAITLTNPDLSSSLDFGILCQPVITMEPPFAHHNSSLHLLGNNPSEELLTQMSAEKQVTATTPPVFIFETADDPVTNVENSLLFAEAMRSNGRGFEILVLPDGPHGLGLAGLGDKYDWSGELGRWMEFSI